MNIDEFDGRGRRIAVWCFGPEGHLPLGDVMLAQKLALETDEQADRPAKISRARARGSRRWPISLRYVITEGRRSHAHAPRVDIAGITLTPTSGMQQIARSVTMEGCGALRDCRYLLHDRDAKYAQSSVAARGSAKIQYSSRWARSDNARKVGAIR
jgi:hypothetical protein